MSDLRCDAPDGCGGPLHWMMGYPAGEVTYCPNCEDPHEIRREHKEALE